MKAELAQDDAETGYVPFKKPRSTEDRVRIIDECQELLRAGRPLIEILDQARRLSEDQVKEPIYGIDCNNLHNDSRSSLGEPPALATRMVASRFADGLTPPSPIVPSRLARRLKTWRTPMAVVAGIIVGMFAIAAYLGMGHAEPESPDQSLLKARERGQLISRSLRPALDLAELKDLPRLGAVLERNALEAKAVTLLFAPNGGHSFYYAASWSSKMGADLDSERQSLISRVILDRLPGSCHNGKPFELRLDTRTGGNQMVAVYPLWTPAGCWPVLSWFSVEPI